MHSEQFLRGKIYCTPLTYKIQECPAHMNSAKEIHNFYNIQFVCSNSHLKYRLIYYQSTWSRATRIFFFSGSVHWCCWNFILFLVSSLFPNLLPRFVETKSGGQFVFSIQSVESKSNLNKYDHRFCCSILWISLQNKLPVREENSSYSSVSMNLHAHCFNIICRISSSRKIS